MRLGAGRGSGGRRVSFPFLFKLTLYCLTLDALAALYLTDLVAVPTLFVRGIHAGRELVGRSPPSGHPELSSALGSDHRRLSGVRGV